jgi:hypothetical protein
MQLALIITNFQERSMCGVCCSEAVGAFGGFKIFIHTIDTSVVLTPRLFRTEAIEESENEPFIFLKVITVEKIS